MRQPMTFDGLEPIERLEEKVSPTTPAVGGIIDTSVISASMQANDDDDPPPVPEPPLPPCPGGDPPIDYPPGSPSGPAGPGS
jgi:hypothetical protein